MDLRGDLLASSPQRDFAPCLSWPDDWRALLRTRVNILVTGPDAALEAYLRAAQPAFRPPIRSIAGSRTLALQTAKTLIVRDVDKLSRAAQRMLFAWMDVPEHRDTQIVSMAAGPLLPLVQANLFDLDLYYRLNTIWLEAETVH
jgi:hypothetical protein